MLLKIQNQLRRILTKMPKLLKYLIKARKLLKQIYRVFNNTRITRDQNDIIDE